MPSQTEVSQGELPGAGGGSISSPLLSTFANDDDSNSEWEDDRTPSIGSLPTSALLRDSSPAESGTANASSSSSSQGSEPPSAPESPEIASSHPPQRQSIWGGLLNAVSRPLSDSRSAATDGVFGNLVAKTETHNDNEEVADEAPVPDDNDDITPEGHPPTYEEASADATPSYWETTIMTYSYGDEVIIGQMPVGSLIMFAWNLLMSSAFSYVGFIFTYLFHTTHSAKGGSLVGLGITLIQSSYDMSPIDATPPGAAPPQLAPLDPNSFDPNAFDEESQMLYPRPYMESPPQESHGSSLWLSNVIFAFGIIMIFKGLWDYGMALRMEAAIIKQRREQEAHSEEAQAAAEMQNEHAPDTVAAEP